MLGILMFFVTGGRSGSIFKPGTTARMIWREMWSDTPALQPEVDRYTGF